MRTVLVDDEPVARKVLREELEAFTDVEVVAEADNGRTALAAIEKHRPNVVFLDLQMPVMNGLDTIARLPQASPPAIVILTAYDQFAIQAFEAGAVDYLLKPVGYPRLKQTIERLRRLILNPRQVAENTASLQQVAARQQAASETPAKPLGRIVGKHGDEFFLLQIDDVLAIQADGELTWILMAKRRYLATQNLKALEARLGGSSFRRVHRNALININHIQKMSTLTSQRWLVTLTNGQQLTVSKRLAGNVRDVLHW